MYGGMAFNKNIEKSVQECRHCREEQLKPHVAPLQLWKWSSQSWVRLHINFAGSFEQDDPDSDRSTF